MDLIEVRDLEKTYQDDDIETPALKGVSFSIKRGEFVAVMGPSGSGKSTLLHLLGFLDRPTKGEYFLDGKQIDDFSDQELAEVRNKRMGFVFQNFNLLARTTVLDNIKLPLLYAGFKELRQRKMAARAIEAVGLSHRLNFETSQLSGGERQRVAIARAVVNSPAVIFADEPTGNLDSKSGQGVMEILQRLNQQGHTIILVTHETYTAQYAQRILKMKDGQIEVDSQVSQRLLIEKNPFIK